MTSPPSRDFYAARVVDGWRVDVALTMSAKCRLCAHTFDYGSWSISCIQTRQSFRTPWDYYMASLLFTSDFKLSSDRWITGNEHPVLLLHGRVFRKTHFFFLHSSGWTRLYFSWNLSLDRHSSLHFYQLSCSIPCFTWNTEDSGRNQDYPKSRSTSE